MDVRNIRVVSWNIRAGGGKRIAAIQSQLLALGPDIICLNEFRGTPASCELADNLVIHGFVHQLTSTSRDDPAKNALLIASRIPIRRAWRARMPDNQTRWLAAHAAIGPGLFIGAMHIPNYTHPELKYPYLNSILDMVGHWRSGPALLIGDTNCGKRGIDEENYSTALFRREHDWMEAMEKSGWADAYRHLRNDKREFTWYSHRNNGFRLDQAFCSPKLQPAICCVQHIWAMDHKRAQQRNSVSDHAALVVDLNIDRIA